MSFNSKKAKTQRSKRALADREPKLVENVKKSLLLKGPKVSEVVKQALKDMHKLKQPDSKIFSKPNMTRPFQDLTSLEFFSRVNDTSLFVYGSHSKKRQHNLVIGRMFDAQMLDMVEVGIDKDTFKPLSHFSAGRKSVARLGGKPMFVFQGEEFESNEDLATFKSIILDFYRGEVMEKINLASLDRVIVCSVVGGKIYFRHYAVAFKRSGSKTPRVELEEVGPSMDLTLRRTDKAAVALRKQAMKVPKGIKAKKVKNVSTTPLGDKLGRIHLGKQEIDKISVSKLKGLKKRKVVTGQVDTPGYNKKQK